VSISNYLTLLRIFLIPLLVTVLLTGNTPDEILTQGARLLAIGIFTIAALTDVLDGWLARLRNEVSRLGTLLDPIADKLLISAAFVSLVQLRLAPAWMVVIILGREFAVSGLRLIAASEGFDIEVSRFAKYKMVAQVFAVGFLILAGETRLIGIFFLYVVLILAIYSMIGYIFKFWRGMQPERRRQLNRRRTLREMKAQVLATTRTLRERRRLRKQKIQDRKQRPEVMRRLKRLRNARRRRDAGHEEGKRAARHATDTPGLKKS
jgi:CDP-diacylglycerol--glycerol-3-phosphate 3-phosphatidyltransferase